MSLLVGTGFKVTETDGKFRWVPGWVRALGPGMVTGASDDDPSGIATYSQAGAQYGYGMAWAALLTFPLMAAVQEICDRIALASGTGLGGAVRKTFGRPIRAVTGVLLIALLLANTLNIAADLAAIGAGMLMLHAGPPWLWAAISGLLIGILLVAGSFDNVAKVLRLLALCLLLYLPVVVLAQPDPVAVLKATFVPHIQGDGGYVALLVAVLGTTLSPYLYFWQAAHRAEDRRERSGGTPRKLGQETNQRAERDLKRSRADVLTGMALSNVVMFAIIVATGATLHANGTTTVDSAAQAAQALKPVAGPLAGYLFAFGFIATGILATPVLAGSAADGIAGLLGKKAGYSRSVRQAPLFYALVLAGTIGGAILSLVPVNPIRLLVIVAIINGVVAVPFLILVMVMSHRKRLMGKHANGPLATLLGWAATAVMAAAAIALALTG